MPDTAQARTPGYFRLLARFLRPFPDFDFSFINPVRAAAVRALALRPGDRALDVGCGPGGSLPFLRATVGDTGSVVSVEISPVVAQLAEQRIARHGWQNVQVQVAPAQTVALDGEFDGLLMFAAPDDRPWILWEPILVDLQVREYFFGWMFLATGRLRQRA